MIFKNNDLLISIFSSLCLTLTIGCNSAPPTPRSTLPATQVGTRPAVHPLSPSPSPIIPSSSPESPLPSPPETIPSPPPIQPDLFVPQKSLIEKMTSVKVKIINGFSGLPLVKQDIALQTNDPIFPFWGWKITDEDGFAEFKNIPISRSEKSPLTASIYVSGYTFQRSDPYTFKLGDNPADLQLLINKYAPIIDLSYSNSFGGTVYDDNGVPLDGATVIAPSQNQSVPFQSKVTTVNGSYSFSNAPAGISVDLTVTKPGFTTRHRVVEIAPNPLEHPDINKYDFGNTEANSKKNQFGGSINNALSDKPEVIAVSPVRYASDVDPKTNFIIKFSEPMDRQSVENAFSIHAYSRHTLTIDAGSNSASFEGDKNTEDLILGERVWDKNAFRTVWNSTDTEVTFIFKDGQQLPSDKEKNRVPEYQIGFTSSGTNMVNGIIKDKTGLARTDHHFKLTDTDYENYYKFAVRTDEQKPGVRNIIVSPLDENGNQSIKLFFNEPMLYKTLNGLITAKSTITSPAGNNTANNYTIEVLPGSESSTLRMKETWQTLGGTANFDPLDPSHQAIELKRSGNPIFAPGDTILITVAPTILDPAGNPIDPQNQTRETICCSEQK